MAGTSIYADGNGNITVNGQTMTAQQYMDYARAQAGNTAAATPSNATLSGKAIIESILAPLGLQGLADWAWQAWNNSGGSIDYVESQLPQQQAFKDRFPEYDVLAARGEALTPAQIVQTEQSVAQMFQQYGIAGMDGYDPKTAAAKMLEGNISLGEMDARLQARQSAAAQYHPDVAAQLARLGGPGDLGTLTAYATDPKNALAMIQQRVLAAQVAAKASNTGFGQLTAQQATGLAQQGVTADQAQQGFSQLAQLNELRQPLAGQAAKPLTDQTLLGAQFGSDAADQQAVTAAQQRQRGYFTNGGSFASAQSGISGSGSATR